MTCFSQSEHCWLKSHLFPSVLHDWEKRGFWAIPTTFSVKANLDTSAEFCGSRTHIIPKLSKFVFLKQFIWSDNIFVNSNSWTTNSSMRCLIHVQRLTDFLTEGHEHAIHIVQLTVIWCQTKYIALHQTKLHNQCTWCAPFILENTQTLEFQVASVLCCHKADT